MSVICQTFPSPEWDNKKHLVTKIQRNHDKFFIEAMCTSFVLCSMSPSAERKKAPTDPKKLAEHNAFLQIQDQHCERAARCIHRMCVDLSKRLSMSRQVDYHNYDHKDLPFTQQNYVHYARVLSELKAKCGSSGGVVVSWPALLAGKRPRMLLPHYLLLQEFVHMTAHLSDYSSRLLPHVVDDMNNVLFNDSPDSMNVVCQLIQDAATHGERMPSE
jgi:hypothetical protein